MKLFQGQHLFEALQRTFDVAALGDEMEEIIRAVEKDNGIEREYPEEPFKKRESMTEREEVYEQAILRWGSRSQLEMAQEEATELALAIRKYIRNDDDASFAAMIAEIADVEIMIEQIEFLHREGANMRAMIDHQKEYKILRLEKRLNQ